MGQAVTDNVETGTLRRGGGPPRTAQPWPSPTACGPRGENGTESNKTMAAVICSFRLVALDVTDHRGQGCNKTVPMDATAKYQEPDDLEEFLRMSVPCARDIFAAGGQGVE